MEIGATLKNVYFMRNLLDFVRGTGIFESIKDEDRVMAFSGQDPIHLSDGTKANSPMEGAVTEIFVIDGKAYLVPRDKCCVPCYSAIEFRLVESSIGYSDWGEMIDIEINSLYPISEVLPRWSWHPWKMVKMNYLPDPDEDYDYWSELWAGYGFRLFTYDRELKYRNIIDDNTEDSERRQEPKTNLFSVVVL